MSELCWRRGNEVANKRTLCEVFSGGRGFNTLGQLELPEEALVEIISPGHVPDSLTPEQIRTGVSNRRNQMLAEHAAHILPYRGMGTGVPRALNA